MGLSTLVKAGLFLGLLAYLVSGVGLREFLDAFRGYDLPWLGAILATVALAALLMALRWIQLVPYRCPFRPSLEAFCVSAGLNLLLPAKLGEASRPLYLKLVYGFRTVSSLSTMVLDRMFDLFLLAAFLLAAALTAALPMENAAFFALGAMALLAGFLLALRKKKRLFMALAARIPFRSPRILFRLFLHSFHKSAGMEKSLRALATSLLLWLSYLASTAIFFFLVAEIPLSCPALLAVFTVSAMGMALPLAPGGIGTYHAGMVLALGWYGVPKDEALAAAVLLHAARTLPMMAAAGAILSFRHVPLGRLLPKR